MEDYVLIYDSGAGGLSVLSECQKLLPTFNYIYFSDSKNAPYGNLSKSQITNLAIKNIRRLKEKFCIKVVVLACNTLTTTAIDTLRNKFCDLDFVGTEPCIKLVKDLGYQRALVISTKATKKNSKVIKEYKTKSDIIVGDKYLAKMVEDNLHHIYRIVPYISKNYSKYNGKIDCAVLGCTHYVFVKSAFESVLGCKIFDSGKFVARRTGKIATKNQLDRSGKLIFCDSGGSRQFFEYFNKIAFYKGAKYVIINI